MPRIRVTPRCSRQATEGWERKQDIGGFDIGPCTNACKPTHPGTVCSGSPQNPCRSSTNCPSGQKCVCNAPGRPLQEYAFDGSDPTAASPFFQASAGAGMALMGPYDSQGNVWVSDTSSEPIKLYRTTPNGDSYCGLGRWEARS